jgi:hypothetical protein
MEKEKPDHLLFEKYKNIAFDEIVEQELQPTPIFWKPPISLPIINTSTMTSITASPSTPTDPGEAQAPVFTAG